MSSNLQWECDDCKLMFQQCGRGVTQTAMKSTIHHLPLLNSFLPSENGHIVKNVKTRGRENIINAVCLVHHLILNRVHPEVWLIPKGGPTAMVTISVI